MTAPTPRSVGIPLPGNPGPLNAITDVEGIEVGYTTLIAGEGALVPGKGPVRTGVTALLPRGKRFDPVFAGSFIFNGNGEMTGLAWVEESGFLEGPVLITNTHSVGLVRDAAVKWAIQRKLFTPLPGGAFWSLPVVAETYDGFLNDINGFHVADRHVFDALESAAPGPVAQGNVGGGTGMICHDFKGGTGTASRIVQCGGSSFTLGVLVQANHGRRDQFTVAGIPVGGQITGAELRLRTVRPEGDGSIIAIIATDAPLLPHQLKRLARRVPMGIARVGGIGEHTSGDIFLAFSTANPGAARRDRSAALAMLPNDAMTPLFEAVAYATEEAILNLLFAADTMTGIDGNTVHRLPVDQVVSLLKRHGRIIA